MKLRIGRFADLCSVSVRTLQHYHAEGLLVPSLVDENSGYRYYNESDLAAMQQILFWRELGFPLEEIKELLKKGGTPEVLAAQEKLLTLKKQRLEGMISALQKLQKGEKIDMSVFDNKVIAKAKAEYAAEAKERWGATAEFAESERRDSERTPEAADAMTAEMQEIFRGFAALAAAGESPEGEKARAQVRAWQAHITKYHYPCTDVILKSLGQMYVEDERFRANLDSHGPGTAEFMAKAIELL